MEGYVVVPGPAGGLVAVAFGQPPAQGIVGESYRVAVRAQDFRQPTRTVPMVASCASVITAYFTTGAGSGHQDNAFG